MDMYWADVGKHLKQADTTRTICNFTKRIPGLEALPLLFWLFVFLLSPSTSPLPHSTTSYWSSTFILGASGREMVSNVQGEPSSSRGVNEIPSSYGLSILPAIWSGPDSLRRIVSVFAMLNSLIYYAKCLNPQPNCKITRCGGEIDMMR